EESPRLGCGMMEMKETTFDWTLNYDEIDYVIDGTLDIIIDGRKVSASSGELIFIPKGSKIQFSVPDYARYIRQIGHLKINKNQINNLKYKLLNKHTYLKKL
uniref:cupin domain-containing protein n=1 Tax=Clostridioides difficile TaxID=1496 RepID=UPI002ED430BD